MYSEQRVPDMDSMLSFQTFFFFVFLRIVVPWRSVRSSAAIVVVPRRSERSISVAAVAAVVPHGASKLTFTQQRAGGGGLAVMLMAVLQLQKRPTAVRGCTDRRKEGGERARDLRIKIGAIKIYQYIESKYGLPILS